jgi:hypothetical protein
VAGWGDNSWGQLTPPADLTNAVAIAAGGSHSLALRSDGTVAAWGENGNADGLFAGQSTPPWGLNKVIAVAAGDYHSVALQSDGTIVAWGDNSQGQCDLPPGLGRVVAIAAGAGHTLALKADGSVAAWGVNWSGQCDTPPGLTNVLAITAGSAHSVVLLGTVDPNARVELPGWRAGVFTALLQTYAGHNYSLEYKSSPAAATWSALPAVAGNGSKQFLVDPNAKAATRCYRVRHW